MSEQAIDRIRRELSRLKATVDDVGRIDAIHAKSFGPINAALQGSPRHPREFDWFGRADEILRRLAKLPDDAGPDAIRSEFG